MPAFAIPVWVWLNAAILIAAFAFVLGRVSGENAHH